MWRPLCSSLLVQSLLAAFISVASAQTLPGATQSPQAQSPVTISPIQPLSAPTSGLPANVVTPSTTSQLEPNPNASGRSNPFSGAGRGLPGMPGGPALNSPLGAKDPTGSYMRPPAVGPLFCDPAVNMPC